MNDRITRRRKPLGPRQRAAYVKPYRAEVEAAKQKIADQEAARDKAEKRLRSLATTAIVTRAQPPLMPTLTTTLELSAYGLDVSTPAKVKASRKALVEGQIAVQINGGSPKVPSLIRRFRRMAAADVRRLRAIDKKLAALREAREALIATAFERGEGYTTDQLATAILEIAKAKRARPSWIDSHAVIRAESALAEAMKHDGTATCPCQPCDWARKFAAQDKARKAEQAKREKAEAKRLAKLGTLTFTCPTEGCGEVTEHAQIDVDDFGDKFVECEVCETSHYVSDLAPDQAPAPGQQELAAA